MYAAIPFVAPRQQNDPLRQRWGRLICEHFGGEEALGKILESRSQDPDAIRKRVRANQMLLLAEAAGVQTRYVMESLAPRWGMNTNDMRAAMKQAAQMQVRGEAAGAGANLVADITQFTTSVLHTSLEIFPRLLANQLVSIQPLTAPSGYVFFLRSEDDSGRNLSDLDLFDKDYSADPGEGEQIKRVKSTLDKELVEVSYRKLMWEASHEVQVALRSQYSMSIEQINDGIVAREMAWEVDRVIIDRLYEFGEHDYYFDPTPTGYDSWNETDKQAYDKNFLRKTMAEVETNMQKEIFVKPNWAIAGSEVIKFLKRLREFEAHKSGTSMGDMVLTNGSAHFAGTIQDIKVWHDPQLDDCAMLVGHTEQMDPFYAGYIWSPFGLASILTAAWTDPDFLLTKKARALAFATYGVRRKQYARVHLRPCS